MHLSSVALVADQRDEFGDNLVAEITRLRCYATTLTRNGETADDLLQDCLTHALTKRHLWREGTNLRGWLFTIMYREFVDGLRQTAREHAIRFTERRPSTIEELDQDWQLRLRDLNRGLTRLPEELRQVILLICLNGVDYRAAAETFGLPLGTVSSRLYRGREALRDYMR